MNLILFESEEIGAPLSRADRRAAHILNILRLNPGDRFDVGLVNGSRGKATLLEVHDDSLSLAFTWGESPPALTPITLIVGLPRPQTARDLLREMSALGVAAIHFVTTEKGESSYAQSTLWSSGEWRRHLIRGAEQAFDTRLPEVSHGRSLRDQLASLPPTITRVALDNYESPAPLGLIPLSETSRVALAIGSERGWSTGERTTLRNHSFIFAHLGPRVLRIETATIAAVAIVRSKLGLM